MAPRVVTLHSANNDFQRAEVLRRNRQRRQQQKTFFVEGVRPINAALANGWNVDSFYYSVEAKLSDWARDILSGSRAQQHFQLPERLMRELSGKAETSELIALVRMPPDDLARIPVGPHLLAVVFDRPALPGNLGTLIRSCDALGVDGLVITGHGADLYDPETITASRGSLFALPVVRLGGPAEVEQWLEDIRASLDGVHAIGSDEDADRAVWEHDFTSPSVLLLGNETWGLSARYQEMADVTVRIPMTGTASSLNVACAASILLYEIARQRRPP